MRRPEDALRSLKKYLAMVLGDDWEVRLARDEGTFQRPYAQVGFAGGTVFPAGAPVENPDITQPFALSLYPSAGLTPAEALLNATATEELVFDGFMVGGGHLDIPANVDAAAEGSGVFHAGDATYQVSSVDRFETTTPASEAAVFPTFEAEAMRVSWDAVPGATKYGVWRNGRLIAYTNALSFTDTGEAQGAEATAPTVNATIVGAPRRVPLWDYQGVSLDQVATARHEHDYMRVADLSIGRAVDPDTDRVFAVTADLRLTWRRVARPDPQRPIAKRLVVERVFL